MIKYRPRPGIVKTKLCGMTVLIPSREAYQACSTIQRLPMLWAATWDAMGRDVPLEETVKVHMIITHKTREEVLAKYQCFCEELCKKGFLIAEETPDECR